MSGHEQLAFGAGAQPCACTEPIHPPRLVVLTGGPGAGKTAVLQTVADALCTHLALVPESASILFVGGFPRLESAPGRRAVQTAIFHVQDQLERLVLSELHAALALCDRGTLDGLAYWPDDECSYFDGLGTTRVRELARYAAVIHLRTPAAAGYNHANPVRIESATQAAEADARIEAAWAGHPRRLFVESRPDFVDKVAEAVRLIRGELPACCRKHFSRDADECSGTA